MRKPIPGLDASFVPNTDGVFYWRIDPEWNPIKRVSYAASKRVKRAIGHEKENEAGQASLWGDLAER